MRRPHANHHLAGNFAPVHDELDETGLLIEGTLPTGLSGVYMRNGPNPYFEAPFLQLPLRRRRNDPCRLAAEW